MSRLALIFGLEGRTLSRAEAAFFAEVQPWGFILFGRNIEHPDQLRRLTSELRAAVGWQVPILIDQEGGRVARMAPPHWRGFPPALDQARTARDTARAMWLRGRLLAADLHGVGIDVNCAPSGDIAGAATHAVIRNRCCGETPGDVAKAARAISDGLLAGGVLPVMKHLPGQGRADLDSHLELPRVTATREALSREDFVPFKALADLPMGMTSHCLFEAIDPDRPATQSPAVVAAIREEIGFDGLLMSDDLMMEALRGSMAERASATWAAGCDMVLHCSGRMDEMTALARMAPTLAGKALRRAEAALAARRAPDPGDIEAMAQEYADLIAG